MFGLLREAAEWRGREIACLSLLLLSASCVPLNAATAPSPDAHGVALAGDNSLLDGPGRGGAGAGGLQALPMELAPVSPTDAAALNAAIPLAGIANPRAASTVFRAAGATDLERSLTCLAEAVFYEARSESEDGQRAVAQVVLNRVRHPAYPGSVCGVVYQGPLRAGGGCQFTFTCDGSQRVLPGGAGWARARRIASEALSGAVYAPVGYATHYHTHQVLPVWAYKLAKVAVIGSHNFYRMPGQWGGPAAFRQAYAGREPSPAAVIATRLPISLGPVTPAFAGSLALPAGKLPVHAPPAEELAGPSGAVAPAPADERLPSSTVRAEYRNSGRWLSDVPAAAR
jgi:spore germination cell wall hydrolase CwlJ-like protein